MASFHFQERGVKEGNKFVFGAGANVTGSKDNLYWSVMPEVWKLGEAVDEDGEYPTTGLGLQTLFGYRVVKTKDMEIIPVMGVYLSHWERHANDKYSSSWTYTDDLMGVAGVHMKYKMFYGKFDVLFPLDSYTDGNPTFSRTMRVTENLEVGIEYKNFTAGVFRKVLPLETVDSKIYLTGGQVGWRF